MILYGVLGAIGFGTTSAQAQYMGSAPAPSYYAPSVSYYGRGYYVAPQPAARYYGNYYFSAPARSYRPSSGSFTRGRVPSSYDPSGRHDGLARPWLR
jgi:hypothetical protein